MPDEQGRVCSAFFQATPRLVIPQVVASIGEIAPPWTQSAQVLEGAELTGRAGGGSRTSWVPHTLLRLGKVARLPQTSPPPSLTLHMCYESDKCHPEEQLIY